MRRNRLAATAVRVVAAAVIATLAAALPAATPAGADDTHVDQLARDLISRFYDDLAPDNTALAGLLGDGFQIIGSDGLRFTREEYLAFPKAITRYDISNLIARRDGNVLTATFDIGYEGAFEGVARTVPSLSRLAVFHNTGDGWKLQAFAALGTGANDIAAEAGEVVAHWNAALASGDPERIRKLAAPDFQLQRPDGKGATLGDEMGAIVSAREPAEIDDLVATSFSNTMVARYRLTTTASAGAPARVSPRMTVFQRINGTWLASADAIYAPIE